MSISFEIRESKLIQGVKIIKPSVSSDLRGNIWTSFLADEPQNLLPSGLTFKHDKFSLSKLNVLRGIHGDDKSWKLVTCVYGEILQVVVDCRKESKTLNRHELFKINKKNNISILVPPRLGNAYYVVSDEAVYHYKLAYKGKYFDSKEQFTRKWNDPAFSIDWPIKSPILSDRDK
jgi:dTDP-4-dehydrorhamnose 3,5-epimerase